MLFKKQARVLSLDRSLEFNAINYADDGTEDSEYQRMRATVINIINSDVLTDRQRDAVRLRFVDGMSNNDVAAVLGVSAGTATRHVNKAMARIRAIMLLSFPRLRSEYTQPNSSKPARVPGKKPQFTFLGMTTGAQ